jgi:prephenate dehydrogenase
VPEPLPILRSGQTASPLFERVGIVGLGLIGGSLALALKQRWPTTLVIAVDRKDVIERAIVSHSVDVGADDLGMVSGADLIVLAAPVDANVRILGELPELVPGEALITDVGSTKSTIVKAARNLPGRLSFIGGHPMAGAAIGGLEHARPDLFRGRPWILDSTAAADPSRLRAFLTALGASCVSMATEEHDHVMAFLSALPQLTASALMRVVGDAVGSERLALAGKGLQDTTRLASSPPGIWKAVAESNANEISRALDALIDLLTELRADLRQGDLLEQVFDSARTWKATLSRDDSI